MGPREGLWYSLGVHQPQIHLLNKSSTQTLLQQHLNVWVKAVGRIMKWSHEDAPNHSIISPGVQFEDKCFWIANPSRDLRV